MDLHCSPKIHRIILPFLRYCIRFLLLFGCSIAIAQSDTSLQQEIHQLDQQFQSLTDRIYQSYGKILSKQALQPDLQQLHQLVNQKLDNNDVVSAISLIEVHMQLLKDNIDDRRVFTLLSILLDYNAWKSANEISNYIKAEGEKSLVSTLSFIIARHYINRHEWQKTIDVLSGTYEDLVEIDSDYARLITGIALQKLKKHREALDYYAKIPTSSRYYIHAQLNTAIVYIRQGWWTDAQKTILSSLANELVDKPDEIVNRLYLVLGYSMLQIEYYRDSRNAFRNINLDSKYTNRALLGIALSAANQEDFIGALNALSILKDKDTRDLSVDECYLLFPFVYQKLNQQMTASATYSDAISYYQQRIGEIDNIKSTISSQEFNSRQISDDNRIITINNNSLDFSRHYPVAFLENIKRLQDIMNSIQKNNVRLSNSLVRSTKQLYQRYTEVYSKVVISLLKERQEYLNSYLNQSRYGLANLYDNSMFNGR